ncbi:hypothetical protein B296_00051137 [Ensete ventricosum]|uniref:Uncharacterized protein n=1 Tax=Ensete ventricosum TaxID=4639 RepID=A0A426YG35_ENSVE|nr:hypothetical protein B296_00051137 [Ensete ventricosum]
MGSDACCDACGRDHAVEEEDGSRATVVRWTWRHQSEEEGELEQGQDNSGKRRKRVVARGKHPPLGLLPTTKGARRQAACTQGQSPEGAIACGSGGHVQPQRRPPAAMSPAGATDYGCGARRKASCG